MSTSNFKKEGGAKCEEENLYNKNSSTYNYYLISSYNNDNCDKKIDTH